MNTTTTIYPYFYRAKIAGFDVLSIIIPVYIAALVLDIFKVYFFGSQKCQNIIYVVILMLSTILLACMALDYFGIMSIFELYRPNI